MKDITYLELVDLDPTPMNRIVNICYPQRKECLRCPHHIITRIAKVSRNQIDQRLQVNNANMGDGVLPGNLNTEKNRKKKEDKDDRNIVQELLYLHQNSLNLLNKIEERIDQIENKLDKLEAIR